MPYLKNQRHEFYQNSLQVSSRYLHTHTQIMFPSEDLKIKIKHLKCQHFISGTGELLHCKALFIYLHPTSFSKGT